jgi:hypothetical protein
MPRNFLGFPTVVSVRRKAKGDALNPRSVRRKAKGDALNPRSVRRKAKGDALDPRNVKRGKVRHSGRNVRRAKREAEMRHTYLR